MILHDAVTVAGTRRTNDGYLVADCRIAKAGNIQVYAGAELGKPGVPSVRVFRDDAAVFDGSTMAAWAYKPVTLLHPAEATVTADNWRDHAIGFVGGEITRDGATIRVPLVLMDGAAISAVRDGTRELSCGYGIALDWQPGTSPAGDAYDARVTQIIPNHVAVVPKGRAGSECRIGDQGDNGPSSPIPAAFAEACWKSVVRDGWPNLNTTTPNHPATSEGARLMADENTRAVVIDGLTVRTNDAGAEAIARLQRQLADSTAAMTTADAAHRTALDGLNGQLAGLNAQHKRALDDKDGEIAGLKATHATAIAAKDADIAALRDSSSDAALDRRVAARTELVGQAKRILGDAFDPTGLSDPEIRRQAAAKVMTLSDAEAANDVFCSGILRGALANLPATAQPTTQHDPLRQGIAAGLRTADQQPQQGQPPTAWAKNVEYLSNAWKHHDTKGAA